ncbi:MAG: prepilin-type N-terminal cleavage/methylation domain-containing protein [Acidobacteriota bacterium]
MKSRKFHRRDGGFTLVEMLIVVVLILVIAAITWPALHRMLLRNKIQGAAQEFSMQVQRAKIEAVKRGVPAVVRVDFASDEVYSFVDLDNSGTFNPVGGSQPGTTDFEINRRQIPTTLAFWAPADGAPEGVTAVNGLTAVPGSPGDPHQAVLEADGSVRDVGAFRLADTYGNFFEIWISPEASALVRLRKWNGTAFKEQGEGGTSWKWTY